jgi:hypothetical protein
MLRMFSPLMFIIKIPLVSLQYFIGGLGRKISHATAFSHHRKSPIFYKEPIIAIIILYFLTFFKGFFEKTYNFDEKIFFRGKSAVKSRYVLTFAF